MEVIDIDKISQASADEEDPPAPEVEVIDIDEISQASADEEMLAQLVNLRSDHAVPTPDNARAQSIEYPTATGPDSEEGIARSVVADGVQSRMLPPINDAIDQLTADLAAFCIDDLERGLTLSNEDREVGSTSDFEDELQVRSKLRSIYNTPTTNSSRSRRL